MEEKKHWSNVSILNHFNCFSQSCTKANAVQSDGDDVQDKDSNKNRTKGGWKTMPFLIGHESLEKLSLVGLQANRVVYLRTKYNMKIVAIVNMLKIISATSNLAILVGAYVVDSYIGRFLGLLIGAFSNLIGTGMWTLTALIPALKPQECSAMQAKLEECQSPSKMQIFFLVMAMVFMMIGSATIRPSATPFGADQFERGGTKTVEQKKSLQSFFNWYWVSMNVVTVVASTVIVYLQSNVSWTLGFGICFILMFISIVGFLFGAPLFYRETPQGSPFTGIAQVIVASIKKRKLSPPADPTMLYYGQTTPKVPVTPRFRFLDKAAIPTEGDMQENGSIARPWRLSSIQRVEDLKILIAILPMFSVKIGSTITSQQYTIFQALTMDRRVGSTGIKVPAASIDIVTQLVIIAWLPLYDRVLVPLTSRITKKERGITTLQRIGIGHVISLISMLVAALVESKRRNVAKSHGLTDDPTAVVPISAFWLVPQFVIDGLADCFLAVGSLDFFYTEFPSNLRSTSIALSAIMYAVGDYLGVFMITLVHRITGSGGKPNWLDSNINRGRLDYFYWLLLVMQGINVLYFILLAYFYKYREGFVSDGGQMSEAQEIASKQAEI